MSWQQIQCPACKGQGFTQKVWVGPIIHQKLCEVCRGHARLIESTKGDVIMDFLKLALAYALAHKSEFLAGVSAFLVAVLPAQYQPVVQSATVLLGSVVAAKYAGQSAGNSAVQAHIKAKSL